MSIGDYNRLSVKDILFVVGAGISKPYPSNIPLGNELTKYILDISCGEKISDKILEIWNGFSKEIKQFDNNLDFPLPRLETILGCISEIDLIMGRQSILTGLHSWKNIPYNNNHSFLADFVKRGASIFTTNFDLGIEVAYESKYESMDCEYLGDVSAFSSSDLGVVYHLHGCARDDVQRLGATMRKVKSGFDKDTETILKGIISRSKLIVFLGYSISDSFDITPLFEKTISNEILFVQHKNADWKNKVTYPSNLYKLFSNCINPKKLKADTTSLLVELSNTILGSTAEYYQEKRNSFEWKEEFNKCLSSKYNFDDKILNLLCLRYHLGIATDAFKCIEPYIVNTIKRVYSRMDVKHERIDEYYEKAIRSFTNITSTEFKKPRDFDYSKVVKFVNKNYLILLRDECEYFIDKYSDLERTISLVDSEKISNLIKILKIYSGYSYKDVQYISYISACLKYLSALSARTNYMFSLEYSKRELMISIDIAYIEGTIAALVHMAEHKIINNYITSTKNSDDVRRALNTAYNLAGISGYNYHKVRIKQLINKYNLQNYFDYE